MTATNIQIENHKTIQSSVTMTVVLITFSMLFATLCMGYMVLRFRSAVWPPMGMTKIGLTIPSVSTLIILLSSLSYYRYESLLRKGSKANFYYVLTVLLGITFSASQFVLWEELTKMGIGPGSGVFGSMLYGFTWIHAAHIVAGLVLLLFLPRMLSNFKSGSIERKLRVKSVGLFWHFLGLVWGILYLMLFVF